jgi:hypothetical protein
LASPKYPDFAGNPKQSAAASPIGTEERSRLGPEKPPPQAEKSGWGMMSPLIEENLRIRIGNAELMAYHPTGGVRQEFLKLYKTGLRGLSRFSQPRHVAHEQPT